MDLGFFVVYGQVIHSETASYTSGAVADGWGGVGTDVVRTIHVRLDGNDGEWVYAVSASFPARPGNRIGVIYGKAPLSPRKKRNRLLGIVNSSTGNYLVLSKSWNGLSWAFWLTVGLILFSFCEMFRVMWGLRLWSEGHHLQAALKILPPVEIGDSLAAVIFGSFVWVALGLVLYPAYQIILWRRVSQYVAGVVYQKRGSSGS